MAQEPIRGGLSNARARAWIEWTIGNQSDQLLFYFLNLSRTCPWLSSTLSQPQFRTPSNLIRISSIRSQSSVPLYYSQAQMVLKFSQKSYLSTPLLRVFMVFQFSIQSKPLLLAFEALPGWLHDLSGFIHFSKHLNYRQLPTMLPFEPLFRLCSLLGMPFPLLDYLTDTHISFST